MFILQSLQCLLCIVLLGFVFFCFTLDFIYIFLQNVVETAVHSDNALLKVVKFATTPKMSTYIIAFIVGDFDHVENTTDSGVLVRVYTSAGKANQGRFALEVCS